MKKTNIFVAGRLKSGKDTFGRILQWTARPPSRAVPIEEWIEDEKNVSNGPFKHMMFASPIKEIGAHLFGYSVEDFSNQDFKSRLLPGFDFTPRQFMQYCDGFKTLDPRIYAKVFKKKIEADNYFPAIIDFKGTKHHCNNGAYLTTDLRFPVEHEVTQELPETLVVKIVRYATPLQWAYIHDISHEYIDLNLENEPTPFSKRILNIAGRCNTQLDYLTHVSEEHVDDMLYDVLIPNIHGEYDKFIETCKQTIITHIYG